MEYTPNATHLGDPTDCQEWSINVTFAANPRQCVYIVDKISISDYILLSYSIITWIVVIIILNSKFCKASYYPATELKTYEKILQIKEIGMSPV